MSKTLYLYQGTVPREYSSTSWVSRSKASDHCLSVSIPNAEVKRQNPKRQASANKLRVAGSLYLYHHADHAVTLRYSGTLVSLEVYHLAVQWNSPMQKQKPWHPYSANRPVQQTQENSTVQQIHEKHRVFPNGDDCTFIRYIKTAFLGHSPRVPSESPPGDSGDPLPNAVRAAVRLEVDTGR